MPPRRVSEQGKALIRQFEGLRLTAYRDAAGVWTIGYGHTKGVRPGMTITKEEAERLLDEDVRTIEEQLSSLVPASLTQSQFDALASFAYNVGLGALRTSTLLRRVNEGDVVGTVWEFAKWVKAGGKTLPGLVRRRKAEAAMFLGIA